MPSADPVQLAPAGPLLAALRRADFDEAERLLTPAGAVPSPLELRPLAELFMRRRQWAQAAWIFTRLPEELRSVGTEMKCRLSANLAALQQHRPSVYDLLIGLPSQHQFHVVASGSGKPTIQYRGVDGTVASLSAGHDPLDAAAAMLPRLYEQTRSGEAIALCGIRDGYLTRLIANNPPPLFMDKQQPIFLIEPEPQVLLQCLMIHEYTGADGPIEAARFQWFVGAEWHGALRSTLLADPYLTAPAVTVGQGFDTPRIQDGLRAIAQELVDRDADVASAIERHYTGLDTGDFASAFSGAAGRPPRVLLLTTRFSTVLQYSTRDTAAAFERLGWEARVVIEPSAHHRVTRSAIASAVAELKPDLVFQIDHLRHEHHHLFPINLPFACWIQDHLPHLASTDVGGRVEELDFVLTDAIATYTDKFAYPARQCIPLPKLVVKSDLAEPDDTLSDDLAFVSNASGTPEAMVGDGISRYARDAQTRELITRCCRTVVEMYERGDALPTYNHVCATLRGTLGELGLSLATAGFDVLARWLTHPFNDALYRQQALRWAAEAAREHGLTLALYGKGWEANPEFRPHARGPIAYGETLRRLTRRSLINLQIVPYLCLHQRLLDGLMAGGFFLVRTHPADLAPAALLRFLEENGAHDAGTTRDAVARLNPAKHAALAGLIDACRPCLCTTGSEDVVEMTRAWEQAGQLTVRDGPLPMLNEVGFHDARGLSIRVRKFAGSSVLRESVSANQRRSVSARLSYDAGVRRVVGRMRELLADTAARAADATRQPRGLAA